MKLDRNINDDGTGKYALVLMRNVTGVPRSPDAQEEVRKAMDTLLGAGVLDFGDTDESEFFVLRLKDEGAATALHAYSMFFRNIDPQWSEEVWGLYSKAFNHPNRKRPD